MARNPPSAEQKSLDTPAKGVGFRPVPRRQDSERRSYTLTLPPRAVDQEQLELAPHENVSRRSRDAHQQHTPRRRSGSASGKDDSAAWSAARDVGLGVAVGMAAGGALGFGFGHLLWGSTKGAAGATSGAAAAKGAAAGGAATATAVGTQAAAAAMANIQTMTLVGMGTGGGAGGGIGAARAHQKLLIDRPPVHTGPTRRRGGYSHSRDGATTVSPRPVYSTSPRPMPTYEQRKTAAATTPPVRVAPSWKDERPEPRGDPRRDPQNDQLEMSGSHMSGSLSSRQTEGIRREPSARGSSTYRSSTEPTPRRGGSQSTSGRSPRGLSPSLKSSLKGRAGSQSSGQGSERRVSFHVSKTMGLTSPSTSRRR
eukprot:Hpha_TRINITY_DN13392_c0_g1::TRINITY_DN13392_c0_g1_i2::g.95490::m.95490